MNTIFLLIRSLSESEGIVSRSTLRDGYCLWDTPLGPCYRKGNKNQYWHVSYQKSDVGELGRARTNEGKWGGRVCDMCALPVACRPQAPSRCVERGLRLEQRAAHMCQAVRAEGGCSGRTRESSTTPGEVGKGRARRDTKYGSNSLKKQKNKQNLFSCIALPTPTALSHHYDKCRLPDSSGRTNLWSCLKWVSIWNYISMKRVCCRGGTEAVCCTPSYPVEESPRGEHLRLSEQDRHQAALFPYVSETCACSRSLLSMRVPSVSPWQVQPNGDESHLAGCVVLDFYFSLLQAQDINSLSVINL